MGYGLFEFSFEPFTSSGCKWVWRSSPYPLHLQNTLSSTPPYPLRLQNTLSSWRTRCFGDVAILGVLVFYEEFSWAAYQISLGRRKGGWRLLEGCFFGVNSAWERILIIDNLIRRGMVLANWCILRKNIKEMRISCFCIVHLLWKFFFLFLAFGVKWVMPNSQKCWKVCYDFGNEVPMLLEIMECWSFFFNVANLEIEE